MSARRLLVEPAAVVCAIVFASYLLVARGVGDLYPFSTFSMYSDLHTRTASRIVGRDGAGAAHELERWDRFRCDGAISDEACAGDGIYSIGYLDREAREYVAAHAGDAPDGEPIEIVRRVWHLDGAGPPRVADCAIARCRARRR